MRFLKGKSLTKELIFQFFRAAGAPILGFSGHNPKIVSGGHLTPPLSTDKLEFFPPLVPDLPLTRGGGTEKNP